MRQGKKCKLQLFAKLILRHRGRWLITLAALVCLVSSGWAQRDRAGLNGTVTDSSGHVLPGVHVVAVQDATGLRREAVSSPEGIYAIPALPVGSYNVTFSLEGFQSVRFENVAQRLEETRTLNVTLPVAGKAEMIEVTGSLVSLDHTTNALGMGIERIQAQELPLNGQNWATLTNFIPTAVDTGNNGSANNGSGNQRTIRYAGRGRDDNNYTYDGIDATNIINQSQQYYVRAAIPIDSIVDIRVDPMLATAQTGGAGGGQLAVASASGTNRFHGEVYDFLRNNVFDATDPIDALNPNHQPSFHLNQFGGALGGPIQQDKTFFFVSYEGYRQQLGQTLIGYVPSAAFSQQILAQSPQLAPIINAYPQGQTIANPSPSSNPCPATVPSCLAQYVGQGVQNGQEDSGMFRLDHRFSDATTAFVRANIDYANLTLPYSPSTGAYLNEQEKLDTSPVNSVISLSHVFSPTLLNETKFGFNRSTANTTYLNQTGSLYAISVGGLTTLNNGRASVGTGNSFAFIDDVSWVKGRHVIKSGVEVRRVQMNQGSSSYGTVSFKNFTSLLNDSAYKASITGEYPVNGLRKTQFFGYFQDEYKWRSNLTLNLGVRYSFFNVFHEDQGRDIPFDFATCGPGGYCPVGSSLGQPNYGDVDPRIAIAWAPAVFEGKTVIRAGFGMFHEDGQLDDQNIADKNEILSYTLTPGTCPGLAFPIIVNSASQPVCTIGTNSPNAEQRNRKDTYVSQWGLSIQQALPSNFLGTLAYVGSKGTHLLQLSYLNVIDPNTGLRPYPQFGQIPWRGNTGNSEYEGLTVGVKRAFARGFLMSANYTWSHEIDDGSNGSGDGDSLAPQNVSCWPTGAAACGERASGAFDARHVVNANAVYELPFGPGKPFLNQPGILRAMFGSWTFSPIFVYRTGFPVNITATTTGPDGNSNNQRPNLVPNQPLYLAGGNINPNAFCIPGSPDALYPGGMCPAGFGNVPRNFLRGPSAWQADMALGKRVRVTEQMNVQFRAEVFNIFNKALYANPDANISDSNFGKLISPLNTSPVGTGTPRQFQFMLKIQF